MIEEDYCNREWWQVTPEEVDARIAQEQRDKDMGRPVQGYDPDKEKGFGLPERNTLALERIANALETIARIAGSHGTFPHPL